MRLLHVLLLFTFLAVISGILLDNGGRSHGFGSSSDSESSEDHGGRPSKPVTTSKPREDWITFNGPFTTTLPIPGGYWDTGKIIRIHGVPGTGRWTINLVQAGVRLFHLSSEPSKGLVVRNRFLNGAWQVEEKWGGNPFPVSTPFNVTLINQPSHIEIHVNGVFFVNFNHRTPNPSRDYQGLDFQFVNISKVEFSR
ncbi:Galectin [Caenorhabditis elegans]|uniref:Galectin n=1 Tax=Caenorhabditis elegans TaxID=6239 RepID=U4PM93_CAEEL|nr:Galectin [Caenorhabditis elegans]CDH93194.1 Galectin [Caenorhabditis elegans]|eukprot:NP_001294425.1 Galectin [Caenorhabditis elegans]